MEQFKFGDESYNIISELNDETLTDIHFKVTDKIKEIKKFLFLPIIFDNKIYWLKKVKIIKRLYFSGYNIKIKNKSKVQDIDIWDKFWLTENIKICK